MNEGPPTTGPDPVEDVYERIADAVFALDEDWRFTFLNEQAERLLDQDEEELLGRGVWEAFPQAVDTPFQREYERAMRTQQPVAFEEYYEPLEAWFEVRAYPSPTGLSVYFHDVTDRVRRRRELRQREQALREAYEVVGDVDRSSAEKIEDLLHVARDVLGTEYGLLSRIEPERDRYVVEALSAPSSGEIEVGDTLGLGAAPCCHDVFREERTLALHDVRAQAPELVHETLGVAAYLGTPIILSDERSGTFCFFDQEPRDDPFTDWEVTYVNLLGNWTSSELDRERGARELEQANRRLETSNRRLESFARAASHDMQEPARTMATHLQLVRDRHGEALEPEGLDHLDFAIHGARRMLAMVRGLQAYTEVETEERRMEPVDLGDVVETVLRDRVARLEETGAEVEVVDLPVVLGDGDELGRLFDHLIDNALRYSGDERPRITIDAEQEGRWWIVSVEDEGVGIEPAYRGRIFDLFERLHGPEEAGGGIGLAVCQRIVERHGGDIWLDSEPGEGSRFSLRLPAAGHPPPGEADLDPADSLLA